MKFCDMLCRYAEFPKNKAVDGSGSCRTFQAIFCKKRHQLVYKNQPCAEKELNRRRMLWTRVLV